jgi:hypothetical protein
VRISELLSITVTVPPREIERFLDALAQLPHHINPSLTYEPCQTHIEFPAWRSWLTDVYALLSREGFESARLRYRPAVPGQSV